MSLDHADLIATLPPASSFMSRFPWLWAGIKMSDTMECVDFIVPVRRQRWTEMLPSLLVGTRAALSLSPLRHCRF